MLGFSLRPEETMRAKNATAYEYMYAEYPFLRPWTDSSNGPERCAIR